ncbi:hypothetical protein RNJ44_01348 [Nakaseomyces bracarensis]|uniref:RRM domain-containing protein n=1 Tax=Nakaseomyces bracarensis TaxID=273131 RepID=A0ABR4NPF1_9SACH
MSVPEATVYVGNVDSKVSKELLYELFIQVGQVKKIRYPKDKISQEFQGYAFVEFFSPSDADYVIKVMNGNVKLYDKMLKIRASNQSGQALTEGNNAINVDLLPIAKLFIKDIAESVDVRQLSKLFSKFGPLPKQPEIFYLSDGALKCAYVYYKFYEDADLAIKTLNNQLVMNKKITIDYAFKENGKKNSKYGSEIDRLLNKEARKNGVLK